jgi:hypothetical protein
MKRHRLILVVPVVVILVLLVRWGFHRSNASSAKAEAQAAISGASTANSESTPAVSLNLQHIIRPPPPEASDAEKWDWWREMSARDKFFDLKMPISFYGLVVDDMKQPIAGARVKFSWTDLSPKGTSQQSTMSDTTGRFFLINAVGRALTVQVEKEGYRAYALQNRFSFDYAMFADVRYHHPDSSRPVVFVLRKNREAEPLIFRENQEAELQPGQSKSFAIGPGGAAIVVERLPNSIEGPRGWAARVVVPNGGLAFAMDEFPFEAPVEGYSASVELSHKSPKSLAWSGDNGAQFFVKTPQGFGRVIVRNTPGMSWVYVTSYFNTRPGSRNLEIDPYNLVTP